VSSSRLSTNSEKNVNESQVNLHIVTGFDDNYVYPFLIMLFSLSKSGTKVQKITIFYSSDSLSDRFKELIRHCSSYLGIKVDFLEIELSNNLPISKGFNRTTYGKLFVIEHLSGLILYLDTDILVLKNISEISEREFTPAGDEIVSAVKDPGIQSLSPSNRALIESGGRYFNAGVMLIDVNLWQTKSMGLRVDETLRLYDELNLEWLDQCVFNFLLGSNFKELPKEFNVFASENIDLSGVRILHYAGSHKKPWKIPLTLIHRFLYLRKKTFAPIYVAYRKHELDFLKSLKRERRQIYLQIRQLRREIFLRSPHLVDFLLFKYEMKKFGFLVKYVHKLFKKYSLFSKS
jgi:UDP-glucose:(glucosyl)LPS alpha-1,3-glucosyltransferase